jgi:hypothetical protein
MPTNLVGGICLRDRIDLDFGFFTEAVYQGRVEEVCMFALGGVLLQIAQCNAFLLGNFLPLICLHHMNIANKAKLFASLLYHFKHCSPDLSLFV